MVGYDIFDRLRLVRFHWQGLVSGAEMTRNALTLIDDPRFVPGYNLAMAMAGGRVRSADDMIYSISHIGRYYAAMSPGIRSALYAADDLSMGMARMYASLAHGSAGYPIRVFRERDAALAYLGIAGDDPQADTVFAPSA